MLTTTHQHNVKIARHTLNSRNQQGVTLFIVLIMLILGLISVLSAARVGILNEVFVGSDSDAQRTFAAAEAMMRDATIDVKGVKDDGTDCNPASNTIGCRLKSKPHLVSYNDGEVKLGPVRDSLNGAECAEGVCAPLTGLMSPFWNDDTTLAAKKLQAASYGQFTGASAAGNPRLSNNKGWYWIEQYAYNAGSKATNRLPVPGSTFPFIMRITVLTEGNKPGTRTILQSYYVPRPA